MREQRKRVRYQLLLAHGGSMLAQQPDKQQMLMVVPDMNMSPHMTAHFWIQWKFLEVFDVFQGGVGHSFVEVPQTPWQEVLFPPPIRDS
jgi:hypothetical protein